MACKSFYKQPNYRSANQVKNHGKVEGVPVYVSEAFNFNVRADLSVNSRDIKSFSIKILFVKRCYTLFIVVHRPRNGLSKLSEN